MDRGRGPEIIGTRITVYDVLDYARAGWHHTAIALQFRLSSDQVLAALRYIEEHKEEVMAEYQKMLERDEKGNPPEIQAKVDAIHAEFQAYVAQRRQEQAMEAKCAEDNGRS
jgi:uncharacterized protein (DUF433 family)